MTQDPIGFSGGLNLYRYANGNPINRIDPTGEIAPAVAVGLRIATQVAIVYGACVATCKIEHYFSTINQCAADDNCFKDCANPLVFLTRGRGPKGRGMPVTNGPSGGKPKAPRTSVSNEDRLPDDALVCRGGACKAESFENGSGVSVGAGGKLDGVSVNSAPNKGLDELTKGIPHGKVGTTTVGDVRAAGGDVKPSPTANNANHATLSGITGKQAEDLMNPVVINPNAKPR